MDAERPWELIRDVTKTHAPELDDGESISVAELSLEAVRGEIELGEMRNSLTLLSLSRVFDLRSPEHRLG